MDVVHVWRVEQEFVEERSGFEPYETGGYKG